MGGIGKRTSLADGNTWNHERIAKLGFDADRNPTPMMEESLLYKLVVNGVTDGVAIDRELFEEVHSSEHGLLRIYKVLNVSEESKAWVADPANRVCDAPGSWYCVGQYPPAIRELIDRRRNFAQLEDFNRGGRKSAYSKLVEKETEKPEF